jgi:peroxiredoxin
VVNRIYNLFKEDKNLNKDIKMIGIGVGAQPEEMQTYQSAFKIEFPLFSDTKNEIQKKLNVQAVPLTVLLDHKGKILMSHTGPIENFDTFVGEIKKHYQTR